MSEWRCTCKGDTGTNPECPAHGGAAPIFAPHIVPTLAETAADFIGPLNPHVGGYDRGVCHA